MGPLLLVDKSFIQSLSDEETDFLGKHFLVIITPILLREICANLLKFPENPDLSKRKVSSLAHKASTYDAIVCAGAPELCINDLLGNHVPLDSQIPILGGQEIIAENGTKGIVFEESSERKMLRRWSKMDFSDEDLKAAAAHIEFSSYDLEAGRKIMAEEFPMNTVYETMDELVGSIDSYLAEFPRQEYAIEMFMKSLGIQNPYWDLIKVRWKSEGKPKFHDFAPYAHYSCRLASIFWVGVTSGLMPTGKKAKALCDHEYLNYLPFSQVFCSHDRFQRDLAKYCLREDQSFVWGDDLKKDLGDIASCYRNMTKEEKEYYELHYGHYPPPIPDSITGALWRKYMRPWKEKSGNLLISMSEAEKERLSKHMGPIFESLKKIDKT